MQALPVGTSGSSWGRIVPYTPSAWPESWAIITSTGTDSPVPAGSIEVNKLLGSARNWNGRKMPGVCIFCGLLSHLANMPIPSRFYLKDEK